MSQNPRVGVLRQQLSKYPGLDPQAVLAVAAQEGLGGGIGDGGHAYGPFQLNNAGGVITRTHPGTNDPGIQNWAWSPQGLNFALGQIANVARGLKGRAAIDAIVNRFERPANPQREIAGAVDAYGQPLPPLAAAAGGGAPPASAPVAGAQARPQPQVDFRPQLAEQLASAAGSPGNDLRGFYSTLHQALEQRAQPSQPQPGPAPQPQPQRGAPIPGGSSDTPPNGKPSLGWLTDFAKPFDLTVTSAAGGKHAEHSYHYQRRAEDFGGPLNQQGYAQMASLAKAALAHPADFVEEIYTGPGNTGYSILNGKVVPNSTLGKALFAEHTNHVHLAR